jgi:hypothetical protein
MITPLRQLAADHAAGRIGDAEYRGRRRELLHQLAAEPGHRAANTVPQTAPHSSRSRRVGLGALVLIALALALQWGNREGEHDGVGALERSVRAITEDPGWGSRELARLQSRWDALSPDQRMGARESAWFGELVETLGDRLQDVQSAQHQAAIEGVDPARLERLLLTLQNRSGNAMER